MKTSFKYALIALALLTPLQGYAKQTVHKVQFDSKKEVSGQKFALKDIDPKLPQNWDSYHFVVIEFKITTAQRFQLGFTTDKGYNELRIMSYVPNAWNKLAIPLKYFTDLPDAAQDLAATFNHARYTGWINLGGNRGPLHGVDSVGVRMRRPINNPSIEIKSISLAVEDPGDSYLEKIPAVDEFGQSNLVKYKEKATSIDQLKKEWQAEETEVIDSNAYNYSRFGGYKQKQVKATGFFRTEKVDGHWWFVDPEGYLFLSVGVDCVNTGGGGNVRDLDKRAGMFKQLPPSELLQKYNPQSYKRGSNTTSFGLWNLYRRYGDDFPKKSKDMVIKRMTKWGLNTIANWSSPDIMNMNQKAFIVPLRNIGIQRDLMGLTDVYDSTFQSQVDNSIKDFVAPYRNNPWLIGYFIGNEPAWLGEEVRLCNLILEGKDRPIKTALKAYLAEKGDTPENRKSFVFSTFRTFLATANESLKKYDSNHLNLGIRFGSISAIDERILKICGENFDVLSFNCYDLSPSPKMMDRALAITNLPMLIGEYHFGSVDRGNAQSLWQVNSQKERGVAYRFYTESAYSHPGLIGTAYFQWCDQDLTGRNDGENYNCGLIDVTDRPYPEQTSAMMETAKRLYDVHSGTVAPVKQMPVNARGHEQTPNWWNK
jgi:hypothetical protein